MSISTSITQAPPLRLKKTPKLFGFKVPVTEETAVSLAKRRIQKQTGSHTIVNFPHSDIGLKSKAEALLKIAYKKALKEYARFIDDRYQGEKAQDRIAKIVEARYQLKRYKEDVSPEEFSPKAIIERWFSFLV